MRLPRLIVITDWSLGPALLTRLEAALSLGSDVAVQHRHPEAGGRQFLDEARQLAELTSRFGNPLFVSERLETALVLGCHVHLPSRGFAVADARALLPSGRLISRAVHDLGEAGEAAGADLALVSPVFPPGSKPGDTRAPLGREGFFALAGRLACPAFALGGVGPSNARALHGAPGAAVVSGVLLAPDPKAAAAEILEAL